MSDIDSFVYTMQLIYHAFRCAERYLEEMQQSMPIEGGQQGYLGIQAGCELNGCCVLTLNYINLL
jgi:hypothetical protein